MGVGDGFGADVIRINGSALDVVDCGVEPQADITNAIIGSRMKRCWDDFMQIFEGAIEPRLLWNYYGDVRRRWYGSICGCVCRGNRCVGGNNSGRKGNGGFSECRGWIGCTRDRRYGCARGNIRNPKALAGEDSVAHAAIHTAHQL